MKSGEGRAAAARYATPALKLRFPLLDTDELFSTIVSCCTLPSIDQFSSGAKMKKAIVLSAVFCGVFAVSAGVSEEVAKNFSCESKDFSLRECAYPSSPRDMEIKDVRLTRQNSSKPCIEGQTWEAREYGVVVSNGCRGEFQVVFEDARGPEHWKRRYDRHDRHDGPDKSYEHRDRHSDGDYSHDRHWDNDNEHYATDIVVHVFQDLLGRYPTKGELRTYRRLIHERNWSAGDVRRDVERRYFQ